MPQSLAKVLVHLIFSTKHRQALIHQAVRPRLHANIVGILDVHSLFILGRTISQADLVEEVKKNSSKWMKAEGNVPKFAWQAIWRLFHWRIAGRHGIHYIQNQEQHHQKISFQDEFRRFLERYRIAYDERYVWD
jgi:putative transposase